MGIFYAKMVDRIRIEKDRLRIFICVICGSVATGQPHRACRICENPAYFYKEIPSLGVNSHKITPKLATKHFDCHFN